MNVNIAKSTFLELMEEISNVDQQVKQWLNIENEKGLVSSYVELVNNIDSGDFEYVVNNLVTDINLKDSLQQLIAMIENYEEPKSYGECKNDVYIVADPKWKEIRDFGKNIQNEYSGFFKELDSKV